MRQITDHQINECNDALTIDVLGEPGEGGADHVYHIHTPPNEDFPDDEREYIVDCVLSFQNGPISEVGTNGVTHEALIAILVDRLRSFQDGPYGCPENAVALERLLDAQYWLYRRTRQRVSRGVEGTHTP